MPLRLGITAALLAALLPAIPVLGLISATITIDGDLDDWSGILASPDNAMSDPVGAADPDDPGTANRDINLFAYTWDADNVYVFIRRTASGNNSVHYLAYVDTDADGFMEGSDRLVDFDFNGSAFQSGASGVYAYASDAPIGDVLGGDGYDMPGTVGAPVAAMLSGDSAADGIRHECSIPWSALGVPAGSPITIKLGCSLNTNLPASLQDNTNVGSLILRDASLSAGTTKGGLAGADVLFTHTLANTGNIADTYSVSGVSARGWPLTVTDDLGAPLSSVSLGVGESVVIRLTETIPSGTADGVRDTLTITANGSDGFPSLSATDVTVAGEVIVIPDLVNSLAPGNVSVFRNVLMNNSEDTVTVDLAATSNKGYAVSLFADDGITPLSQVVLPSGGSTPVQVHVAVPAGATLGTTDLTTLRAVVVDDPNISNSGTDTTNIRGELTAEPNNAGAAGAGTEITYLHTVTNSSTETRTVTLSAAGSFPSQVLADDGITLIGSVTLRPFGGSAQVRVRVSVPGGTASGAVDTTTLTAVAAGITATATDVTTVSTLVFFSDGAYSHPTDEFLLGDTVYTRGSGLAARTNVRFRWLNPTGTLVYTSPDVAVDVTRQATTSYVIPTAGPAGIWTCVLVTNKGAELARETFYAGYRAHISALSVPDVASTNDPISVSATLANDGSAPIAATSVTYLVWYDVDTDSVCSNGDLYVDSSGEMRTYAEAGTELTHETTGIGIAGSSTLVDAWSVSASDLPYAGIYHVSAEWRASDGHLIDVTGTSFHAAAYRVTLSVDDDQIDAGAVDPEVTVPVETISISVDANAPFDLYKVVTGDAAGMGLSTTLANQFSQPSGLRVYSDSYSLAVPWTTTPGPLSASVTYTVVVQ